MSYENQELKINPALKRLELNAEDSTAFIDYKLSRETLFLLYTEVPFALEGKGVGKAIAHKALQNAKDNCFKIIPLCTFVQSYLKRIRIGIIIFLLMLKGS